MVFSSFFIDRMWSRQVVILFPSDFPYGMFFASYQTVGWMRLCTGIQ